MQYKALVPVIILVLLWMPTPVRAQAEPPAQCVDGLDAFYAGDDATALTLLEEGYAALTPDHLDPTSGDCALILCALRRESSGRGPDLASAADACHTALTIYETLDDRAMQGLAHSQLAQVYSAQGDLAAAISAHEQAYDAALESGNYEGAVIALNDIGGIYRSQGRLPDAEETFLAALELARDIEDPYGETEALTGLGRVYEAQGRYAEALDALDRALALAEESDDTRGAITAYNALGQVYQAQGNYVDASAAYKEGLALAEAIGDERGAGVLTGALGGIAWSQGDYALALAYYEEALAIARRAFDRGLEGHYLNSIGLVYSRLGRYADALDLHEQALIIARDLADPDEEAAALHNLGGVYVDTGRLAEALAAYEQSLALTRAIGFRAEESIALNSIGGVFVAQGRYTEALEQYNAALAIATELGNREQEGNVLNNIGFAYYELRRFEDAVSYYTRSLEIARELGQRAEEAKRLGNLAVVLDLTAQYEEALNLYEQALAIQRELGDRSGEAASLNNISANYFSQGRDDEALATLTEALALGREFGETELLARMLANLGKFHADTGDDSAALDAYLGAMEIVDQARAVAGSEAGRTGFAERYADIYTDAVGVYHRLGREADAFYTGERGRSRAFLDSLATGQVELRDGAAADLLQQQQELYAQRLAAQEQLARVASEQPADPQRIAQAQADFEALDRAYSALLDSIAARGDQLAELVPGRAAVLDLTQVQALLDDQTTLLWFYMLGDAGTLAYIISRDDAQVVELPDATPERVAASLADLELWIDLEDAHPQPLVDLHTWLIAPLLPMLQTLRVGIIPHQSLHYAPFAALSDGATYFGERHTLFLLPSASALPYIQANAAKATGVSPGIDASSPALIYGNPASAADLAVLVYAAEEAQAVSGLLGAPAYTGSAASESRLRQEAPSAAVLHLAAHGEYNRANPLYSTIYLAPDPSADPSTNTRAEDGYLEVHEVYALDLAVNELVVLSACESNLGTLSRGDELVGLTRAFFFAGAPTVVASLWSVDDLATRNLMLAFYANLRAGLGKGEALAAAQSTVREQYPSPYYWAAFVLSGDPGFAALPTDTGASPPILTPSSPSNALPTPRGTSHNTSAPPNLLSRLRMLAEKVYSIWGNGD